MLNILVDCSKADAEALARKYTVVNAHDRALTPDEEAKGNFGFAMVGMEVDAIVRAVAVLGEHEPIRVIWTTKEALKAAVKQFGGSE